MARVSGLPDAFIAKLLSPKMPRRIGMLSMHSVLSTLGVKLLMIENPLTTERYTSRLKRREEGAVRSGTVYFAVPVKTCGNDSKRAARIPADT